MLLASGRMSLEQETIPRLGKKYASATGTRDLTKAGGLLRQGNELTATIGMMRNTSFLLTSLGQGLYKLLEQDK